MTGRAEPTESNTHTVQIQGGLVAPKAISGGEAATLSS